jgi:sugar phosphate permease
MSTLDPQKVKKVLSYRYVIWIVLALCYVIVFFHRLATGVVKDDLVQSFGISLTTYASLASTYFYAYLIMQIPSGILADTIGARKTVSIGVLTAGIGSMIFGAAPVIAVAFFGRLLVGLGVSVIYVSILKIISTWFKEEEFGTMTGITSFIGNIGGILAQTPLVVLVGVISWRYAFQLIGILSIILAIVAYIIIRNKPEEMELPSIRQIKRAEMGLSISADLNTQSDKESKKATPGIFKGLGNVLTNSHTWPPFFLFTFVSGGFIALSGTWGQSYLTEVYGFAKSTSANYISVIILFLATTSIVIGKVSDRIQKRKLPMIVALVVNVLCWGILVKFIDNIPQGLMIPFFAIFGASFTAFILTWACGKEVNNPETAGVSMSVINMGGFLGPSIIPTIMGSIIDKYSGVLAPAQLYQRAFMVCFICSILALISVFFIIETNCKNVYRD